MGISFPAAFLIKAKWPLLLVSLAAIATVALRVVPFYTPVTGAWAELSIRQQLERQIAARQGKAVGEIDPAILGSEVDKVLQEDAASLAPARAALEQGYRDAITFIGEDGKRHVYLGGYDGYYWLRQARALLERGTVCGGRSDGACIDSATNAPIGRAIDYVHSPFAYLIAGTHRIAQALSPGIPLSSSAMLVPIALSALAVIPCFLLGWRIAGALGGFIAALLVFLNPYVFARTAEADNDIMAVVLPLAAMWLLVEAVGDRPRFVAAGFALLSGVTLGLLGASWSGWPFFYLVAAAGLVAVTVVALAKGMRPVAWNALLALAAVSAGLIVTLALFGTPIRASEIAEHLLGTFRFGLPEAGFDSAPGADIFATVGELVPVGVSAFADALGPLGLALGLVGLPLAMAPLKRLPLWALAAPLALSLLLVLAGMQLDWGRGGMMAGLALVLATALLALVFGRGGAFALPQIAALLCTPWLAASLITGSQAQRFVILATVPLGLSAGIGMGLAAGTLINAAKKNTWAPLAPLAALALIVVAPPALAAYRKASALHPGVNDAWAETFAAIKKDAAPNAILNLWWDYGHWATYFSDRSVTVDGASLRDRTVQWMARAFAAPSDKEAVAILRMLACGDVIDPSDDTRARPYEMLVKWGGDEALAYRTVTELMRLDAGEAPTYLERQKLAPQRAKALIATLYCRPPDTYLVLTSALLNIPGWTLAGFWDPYRAYIMALAHNLSRERAIPVIRDRFALPEAMAERLYAEALAATTQEERNLFAAPDARLLMPDWSECIGDGTGLRCVADIVAEVPTRLEASFDPADPANVSVAAHASGEEARQVVPGLIQIVRPDRIEEIARPDATMPNLALLIDPETRRIYAATRGVAKSLLARLILLGGAYSPLFRKTGEQLAFDGQRITTWRIEPDAP